jgi:hypothetical protein
MITDSAPLTSSFRDPSGFLFYRKGELYRQINRSFKENYDTFIGSGLYERLVSEKLLVSHEEINISPEKPGVVYKIIKPEKIPFISYPFEWSFSQLKSAALLTLELEKIAMNFGMTLKDANAYNIQFLHGRPIFIDTLSFERYEEGTPWIAYHQFCKHFLSPISLMEFSDIRLGQLSRVFIDGIPLDLTSSLLPKRTWLNFGVLMHVHLHARTERKYAKIHTRLEPGHISKHSFLGIIDSLTTTVDSFHWKPEKTEWADYYQATNYSPDAFDQKKEIVGRFIDMVTPGSVWDLGANDGSFSRIASDREIPTLSFDIDPSCVELNYREILQRKEKNLLPLLMDLTNPSPGLGWQNEERISLCERGPADMVLALALVHHLALSNNVPLERIAGFFASMGNSLIIEFVPKTDSQVQKLLMNRKDIFDEYDVDYFERAFSDYFTIENKERLISSDRIIYLMKKR